MKRISFIILVLFARLSICAQQVINLATGMTGASVQEAVPTREIEESGGDIIVTCHFPYARLRQDPIFPQAILASISGFAQNYIAGQPNILFRTDAFNIPLGSIVSVELIDSSYIDVPMELGPARPPLSMEGEYFYSTDNIPAVTEYQGYFPLHTVEYIGMQDYRGEGIAHVAVRPIQYSHETQTTRFYSLLKYRLRHTEMPVSPQAVQVRKRSITDHFVSNNTLFQSEAGQNAALAPSLPLPLSESTEDNIGYLIVTSPQYRAPAKRFTDWKRTLGFRVDTLIQDWNKSDTAVIRQQIAEKYAQSYNLNYLLIIGDDNEVPLFSKSMFMNFSKFAAGYDSKVYSHSTDYYYGLVGNDLEVPRLKRGRILVKDSLTAENVFDKIISYEKNPPTDSTFYKTGLHVAQYQDSDRDGYEDFRFTLTSEEIRNHMLMNGKTVKRIYTRDNNPDNVVRHWNNTLFSGGGTVPDDVLEVLKRGSSSQMLIDSINAGAFYLLYYDHGRYSQWEHPKFDKDCVLLLDNKGKWPFVISSCCYTGVLSYNDNFATTLFRQKDTGCIGIVASSDVITEGMTSSFVEGMFSNIWPENGFSVDSLFHTRLKAIDYTERQPVYRLGDILDGGIAAMKQQFSSATFYGNGGYMIDDPDTVAVYHRYMSEIFNLLGDPAMELYTDTPQEISSPLITVEGNSIRVETTDGEARISFYNISTGTVDSYIGTSVTYPYAGDHMRVSVVRHNYVPYIAEIGDSIYIQNEEIDDHRSYIGKRVMAGNHVTDDKPAGNVFIRRGSSMRISGGTVVLDKGTKIEKGSNVTIN